MRGVFIQPHPKDKNSLRMGWGWHAVQSHSHSPGWS